MEYGEFRDQICVTSRKGGGPAVLQIASVYALLVSVS